ncbi:MAG TPA: hypothetical protein VLA72_04150 [Anaerolineales bacterium]|nr:hypothetical protein [Anaerolineales bacterium]
MNKTKRMKIAALVFPGMPLVILLLFAIGETAGGDWSGLGHLIQAIPLVLLMWLGWKYPLWGGILLLVLSFIAGYSFANPLAGSDWLSPLLIIVAPLILSGILFLSAAQLEKELHQ